jgi:hypothetical protein
MFPARTSTHASSSITPLSRIAAAVVTAGLFAGAMTACSTGGHQQIAAAAAEVASSSTSVNGARTLSFVATDIDGNSVTIDLGHKNPGEPDIGDLVAFTQDLAADGKNVGQVHVIAAVVDHTQHLSEATGTIVLKNGSIQLAGVVAMDPKFTLTVTGGTGDYVGATGTMDFDASGDAQTMTVRLR